MNTVVAVDPDAGLFQSTLPIGEKLERARLRLLDLTARNRLLNVPRSSSRSASLIDIVDERASEAYRQLVRDGKALTFAAGRSSGDEEEGADVADEIVDLAQPEDTETDARGVLLRHADNRLQTRLTSKGLQKRLLNLYYDARTLEEEQGVNVLYLALGLLKWVDPRDATKNRFAPLVLVPVSLERATAGDRFKLRWRQEDPSSNLSLEAMVDRDFKLKLPPFEAAEDFDISAYSSAVRDAIASKPTWEVQPDAMVLGFFSFTKFLMYRDLAPDTWPGKQALAEQPLIRSLLRDGFPTPPTSVPDDAHIDSVLSTDSLLHIVDADSSQTLAVHDASEGRNLVIQGPPGTGKSQTIANIIASAIANGKTVLFVAEKMAALDVVKRRLDAAGVGDACLELHSNKANKRLLLDELRRTWELGTPLGSSTSTLTQRLAAARDDLNAHVERLHLAHPMAQRSPYDVLSELVRLRDAGHEPNDIGLPEALGWSPDDFDERSRLLTELGERVQLIGQPSLHPWRGVGLDVVLPNQLTRLLDRISSMARQLEALRTGATDVARQVDVEPPSCIADLATIRGQAERLASAPALEGAALGHDVWVEHRGSIDALLRQVEQYQRLRASLVGLVRSEAESVAVDAALATLCALPEVFSPEAFARCQLLVERLPTFVMDVGRLKAQLGLETPVDTLSAVSKAATTGQRVAAAPDASPDVFAAAIWDTGIERAAELAEAVGKWEEARAEVGDQVLASAWTTDTDQARQVLRLKGGSWLRWLSGEWRTANALVRSLVKDTHASPPARLSLLDRVSEGQAALRVVQAGEELGRSAFGADWQGERSHAAPLRALVAWMRSLRGLGATPRLIAARIPDRSDIGTLSTRVQQALHDLRPHLEALWADLGPSVATGFDEAVSVLSAPLSSVLARVTDIAKCDLVARQVLASPDVPAGERNNLLLQLREAQSERAVVDAGQTLGEHAFGTLWLGPATSVSTCNEAATWIDANADIRSLAALLADRSAPYQAVKATAVAWAEWQSRVIELLSDLRTDTAELFGTTFDQTRFDDLAKRAVKWGDNAEQLSKWTSYRERAMRARQSGLSDVVARLEDGRLAANEVTPAFEMAYFEALLGDLVCQDGALARFDGELHDRTVKLFAELDIERMRAARVEVVQSHHRRLPARHGGVGPLGVLRGEMAKKSALLPIRQLMQKAGPAVQALKPVLMMSPLSIAQFLPPGQISFDLLVMDEASQIQPVDALGAIARCRQVVVVGDERQLPPTRFFAKVAEGEEDDDDGAQVGDIESILGLFKARGLHQRMLRWHYRSRHQSLIAVSNSQFYENKLIIVPSPFTAEAGMGLSFHHLPDGVFDSGGSGANAVEALAVAQAIIRHARTHAHQSLGVATFSVRQRRAILDQLEILRREHPETEQFFHDHSTEPFFVKNLENVQGDERDVILISVGYARNAQGVLAMRFGPLGNEGGERRLNVLISRAKLRCEVYSSITDDDIDLERARGKGVIAFKLFLRFARTGRMDTVGADAAGAPDAFESQVASALHARGYQVHPRVGIAGLYVDLAVSDPEFPGRYVLGIECDGRSYRASRSARDRDRLRRSVLEDQGWMMHRIWSIDWLHRPNEEMAKLVTAIDAAKRHLAEGHVALRRRRAVQVEVVTIERERVAEVGLEPAPERSGAPRYTTATIRALAGYPDIPSVPAQALARVVEVVVATEGPVHIDVVVARIRDAWGFGRAGNRIQSAVEDAVAVAVRERHLHRASDFLSVPNAPVVARDRSAAGMEVRKVEMVAPSEVRAAIVDVAKRNLGVRREELANAVARWLGFAATSAALRALITEQAQEAQRRRLVHLADETWVATTSS